jgi:4-hydroxy-3-polyprenylbenzoate decarboxylase
MAYKGLTNFIEHLESEDELLRISVYVNPELEIAEITDRVVKSGKGKAILFKNTGTQFPLLINAFGSDKRLSMALGASPDDTAREINSLFEFLTDQKNGILQKIASLPKLKKMASIMPAKMGRKGKCQEIIHHDPDLGILPVLKCWPYDGGKFVTLPIVHTIHPETGKRNAGMYRMQILDKNTTAMHWQRHKTGANHYEAWKKTGRKMPVSVVLGGDPVYTYASTAPLPENIDEYILAGFLRHKKVRMVKCITNELYVPDDADIVIEGYVDPSEDLVWEGPFGDHTGFYSLADWYPKFHVTCITHSQNAVYPATIVGIPPQEDAWIAKATEKIFLSPIKLALQPEITDVHMPDAGTAHNLVIVKINKSYPGQGLKVISSLFGAGQMMFSKYIVVVSGNTDIRNYKELAATVFSNFDPINIIFTRGPLDVLDHATDSFSFGGKAGLDATNKFPEEIIGSRGLVKKSIHLRQHLETYNFIEAFNHDLIDMGIPVLIISVNQSNVRDHSDKIQTLFKSIPDENRPGLILVVDYTVDIKDYFSVCWQVLANSDPNRDHFIIEGKSVILDGTVKAFRQGGFPRKWPNIVCSDNETISTVNKNWNSYGIGELIDSPSSKYCRLTFKGNDEVLTGN